jgi:hypothetical protein
MANSLSNTADLAVPISELPKLVPRLTAVMTSPNLEEAKAAELIRERVSVACVQCGQLVSGEELARLAAESSGTGPTDRRLVRLNKGYCVSMGCDSFHYRVNLEQRPGEDWHKAIDLLRGVDSEATGPVQGARRREVAERRKQTMIRVTIGVAILLVALLIRYRMAGGRIPGIEPEHKYRADPASHVDPPSLPRR